MEGTVFIEPPVEEASGKGRGTGAGSGRGRGNGREVDATRPSAEDDVATEVFDRIVFDVVTSSPKPDFDFDSLNDGAKDVEDEEGIVDPGEDIPTVESSLVVDSNMAKDLALTGSPTAVLV